MKIRDVRITGLNAGDFSIVSSDAPSTLAPNSFCTINVAFSPSALGSRQAAVSLSCDAANTTALSVPLSGMGWNGLVIAEPSGPRQSIGVGSCITMPDAGTGMRSLPVYVSWSASSSPQVTRYDLQQSVNGGPFMDAPIQPGSSLGVTLAMPLPASGAPPAYRFRVRAAGGGETSGWVAGSQFALEPVDDASSNRVAFTGTWTNGSMPGNWGGGHAHHVHPDQRATEGLCPVHHPGQHRPDHHHGPEPRHGLGQGGRQGLGDRGPLLRHAARRRRRLCGHEPRRRPCAPHAGARAGPVEPAGDRWPSGHGRVHRLERRAARSGGVGESWRRWQPDVAGSGTARRRCRSAASRRTRPWAGRR